MWVGDIQAIIVAYRNYAEVNRLLDSIYSMSLDQKMSSIHVIDNSEGGAFIPSSSEYECVVTLPGENLGYARAVNRASRKSRSEFILVMNQDIEFRTYGVIDEMLSYLGEHSEVGMVTPFQISGDTPPKVSYSAIFQDDDGYHDVGWGAKNIEMYRTSGPVDVARGSIFMIRRSLWDFISQDEILNDMYPGIEGAMPEHFLYYEDDALSRAVQRYGSQVHVVGSEECTVVHYHHTSIRRYGDNGALKKSAAQFDELMERWGLPWRSR